MSPKKGYWYESAESILNREEVYGGKDLWKRYEVSVVHGVVATVLGTVSLIVGVVIIVAVVRSQHVISDTARPTWSSQGSVNAGLPSAR